MIRLAGRALLWACAGVVIVIVLRILVAVLWFMGHAGPATGAM